MSKIIGVGPHYSSTLKERGLKQIEPLFVFLKPTTTIISNNETIYLPKNVEKVVAEVEVAIKLNKKIKNNSVDEIRKMNVIAGYAIACDITAIGENVFGDGKMFDTFTPLGIFNESPSLSDGIEMKSSLNGALVQNGNTREMGYSFEQLISYCSCHFSLEENDIILTGTPSGTFQIKSGDVIKLHSPQLGDLIHEVK